MAGGWGSVRAGAVPLGVSWNRAGAGARAGLGLASGRGRRLVELGPVMGLGPGLRSVLVLRPGLALWGRGRG